ncbi:DUF2357 domain-containing protein [Microbulbifer sp. PAAF003]|uniref:DUF2357 domain-containing protein n=1 Tax=Microbulbifer sp. PAAF003 TaxID=3243375 RepID=UPI004039900B
MELLLKNLKPRKNSWEEYLLLPANEEAAFTEKTVFETDQIEFELKCPPNIIKAKLFIGDAEISGALDNYSDVTSIFKFTPRRNRRYGYDALFLHYCGIANMNVLITSSEGIESRILFESINVCGRKITAQRIEKILNYLSNNITQELLNVFSPTQFRANLANNGVSIADRIQRLENTLEEVDEIIRVIMHRPIKALRPTQRTLKNPMPESLQGNDIEWVLENAGQSVEADCPENAIFHSQFRWLTMEEVENSTPLESTNIQENQLIRFFLITLRSNASEILSKCKLDVDSKYSFDLVAEDGATYRNFYSIANKFFNRIGSSYSKRAEKCFLHCGYLIRQFDKRVPTQPIKPKTLNPTQKMRSNKPYMAMVRAMHDWLVKCEILWLDKIIFSSINSTWKLFEYYTVLTVNNWLTSFGINESKALFYGYYGDNFVKLLYEPSWPTIDRAKPDDRIAIADRYTRQRRTPDIILDIQNKIGQRNILILDAKCRQERDVWEDLKSCQLKYIHAVRERDGRCPVKGLVLLYPRSSEQHSLDFQDYYLEPFGLNDLYSAEPYMGIQRIDISSDGSENGLHRLLESLLDKISLENFNLARNNLDISIVKRPSTLEKAVVST